MKSNAIIQTANEISNFFSNIPAIQYQRKSTQRLPRQLNAKKREDNMEGEVRTIYVSNVSPYATESDIRLLFEPCGSITAVSLIRYQ